MRISWIYNVYWKEMIDHLRDKKTLISMIVVPTLSIPVLFLSLRFFINTSVKKIEKKKLVLSLQEKTPFPGLKKVLENKGFVVQDSQNPKEDVISKKAQVGILVLSRKEYEQLRKKEEAEKKASQKGNEEKEDKKKKKEKIDWSQIRSFEDIQKIKKLENLVIPSPVYMRVYFDLSHYAGQFGEKKVLMTLALLKSFKVYFTLSTVYRVPPKVFNPFTIEPINVAPPKKMAGMVIGQMLGYFLVIMMLSGGMYAAIDMTAGEKERKTLEMLLSAPITRMEIVLGKVLATITTTFVTAILTLASFVATFYYTKDDPKIQQFLGGMSDIPLDIGTISVMIAIILPLSVLCASIVLAVATFAKSFKEAQSYLTPVIMLAILPAMIGIIPGIKLDFQLSLVPIVNMSLFLKELLLGEWTWMTFLLTSLANLLYSMIAFFFCLRIFQSEKVLFRM
ncbi:MAG: ABC transporter permease [Planctomycetota bacterium]|nr:MAG: ABC transporter permease [Planctomycetota bacterium]